MSNLTHRELCIIGARFLKNQGFFQYVKCQYVVCELERIGESPDAFGFGNAPTQLLEVKISRADFLSDKKKYWRKLPEFGLGEYRSYLCPTDVIKESDLPENWGLYYIDENKIIRKIVEPKSQKHDYKEEIKSISSILRREGITPKIFSYKKYKSNNK